MPCALRVSMRYICLALNKMHCIALKDADATLFSIYVDNCIFKYLLLYLYLQLR